MQTRVSDGVWVSGHRGALHLGVLDGDIEHGWQATFATVEAEHLPAMVRALHEGGRFCQPLLHVDAFGSGALLGLRGRPAVLLGESEAVRLQLAAAGLLTARDVVAATCEVPTAVRSARGMLTVTDDLSIGEPLGIGRLHASAPGAVVLHVPTSAGPASVSLPGLAALVASSEALRDGRPLLVRVPGHDQRLRTVRLHARPALGASADAQWLLPGFQRRIRT